VKRPRKVAITGASSGLGAALAREYAGPGRSLALSARRLDKLAQIKRDCEERGADVSVRSLDVTDVKQVEAWVDEIERSGPVDLLIANAGIFTGHGADGQWETMADLVRQIDTNLTGTMATISGIAPRMQTRGHGHIAMVSSLAALQPLADAPGYSAAKAGILAYGEAIREYLADDNVTVSIILPGNIATAQTAVQIGAQPGIITAEKAAQVIRRRLDRGRTIIAFPDIMHWLIRLERVLPWRVRAWTHRPFRFHVDPRSGGGNGQD